MRYFNKDLLDYQCIERVESTLNGFGTLSNEHTILPQQHKEFLINAQSELIDYYNNRVEFEAKHPRQKDTELPF